MVTSCLCICGVAFWTLPSGIIGSGFALKVEQKKREKQFNRLVPAAASLIQNWWRMIAVRQGNLTATWKIYRIESRRNNKSTRSAVSSFNSHVTSTTLHFRSENLPSPTHNNRSLGEKILWRKIAKPEDLEPSQRVVIRMIRIIKYHVAKRKFLQAHKPYNFKDIMDENAQGNLKIMYTLADIQRRLDQTLGLPKNYPLILSDKDREHFTLNAKVQRLETKLGTLERQTNRVITLLEDIYQRSKADEIDSKEDQTTIRTETNAVET